MNTIIRRAYSTKSLIPPNLAANSAVGAPTDAARMKRVVNFYQKLPKGNAQPPQARGLWGRYKARYFDGDNASRTPLIHLLLLVGGVAYAIDYNFHLKHHKNVEHH
ncbi:hypothetical protein BZG36_03348 [Bifiguratus adelaidae]|uniref:ATP synthase subunit f, mitochondrial n=1 Tax=Bifiguratus adelaidae TaxID=1938954 RepID=A0A261XWP6_9FUNG|nr:hypothetical protein BZG36_03348 [Bifiguratus adelaidae]